MREFFTGWRRKVGCVALLMACAIVGLWMRSCVFGDWFSFPAGGRTEYQFVYESSRLIAVQWEYSIEVSSSPHFDYGSDPVGGNPFTISGVSWEWRGIQLGHDFTRPNFPMAFAVIPYFFLVMPPILLSAYLILWKPRKRKADSDA